MTAATSGKHMDQLCPEFRKKRVAPYVLAGAALLLLASLGAAWMAPAGAQAAPDEPAQGQQNSGDAETVPAADPADGGPAGAEDAADVQVGGAVTGFWGLAWSKAWPPIRNVFLKLWQVTKGVLAALWNVSKDIGESVNSNVNAGPLNAATGAPVNSVP